MRIASCWAVAVAIGGLPAVAQQSVRQPTPAAPEVRSYYQRKVELIRRAHELRPRRRDEPLRYENITDMEVREIQAVAAKFVPKAIVNISPVVTGCPCEEGPQCTDQVYIVASSLDDSVGLQLSRVKNAWQVGVVQRWWLRYDALRARIVTMNFRAYEASEAELFRELPQCVGELVPATTASTPAEVKK